MKGFQGKGKETEELVQLYEKLEQDWHAMKQQSDSRTANPRRCYYDAPSSSDSTMELEPMQQQYHYYCHSPRGIMCGLQRETSSSSSEEEWNNAEEEIFQECVEIIESEKLKGKRLLFYDALEDNEDAEVRSIESYDSDEDHEDEEEYSSAGCAHSCCYSSSSSSSSPFSDAYYEDSDEEVEGVADMVAAVAEMRAADAVGRFGNGRKSFGDFLRWLAFAFLVIAVCARFARSYGGRDDSKVFFVPT